MSRWTALSDLDYLNEHDPMSSCADCGCDIPPGFVRCEECDERQRIECEVANDDPRR